MIWAQRETVLALALGIWLAGYWLADGWHHRRLLWLVALAAVLNADAMARTVVRTRWLWGAAILLGWQTLTRLWAGAAVTPVASPADALAVIFLLTALAAAGRRGDTAPWLAAGLCLLSALVASFVLPDYYLHRGQSFADNRLRNTLVYEDGLNAVLTGMLFMFGACGAAWFSRRADWRIRRVLWLAVLAVLVFGLLATQSRAPMLGGVAAGTVLVWFGRKRMLPAVAIGAVTTAAYFAVLLLDEQGGGEAAGDLVGRGSTGRFSIYHWFFSRMQPADFLIGKGMGTATEIPEEQIGWLVYHPHSSYFTQFYLTGLIGLALLGGVLGWAGRAALREASRRDDALWLALLAAGGTSLLFDGSHIFSLHSVPRIEFLLVAAPAALLMGRAGNRRNG